ncbi:hypothetical protein QRD02_00030 [Aequorivita sp. SDUM287046]|uniref:DUF2304 domain-containing protein n=1 Tax=Aequorivita aurantiaca TaxID=3053356 RepID=A0ABT8DID2_9FLAO|nr:hypothetical protein [Aequorivita aurantiaca]MDN3722752.1 hypothetical protein [Aequorivita aurantiaca]
MDYILISKAIVLIIIFLIIKTGYNKINWDKKSLGNSEKFLIILFVLILTIPLLFGLMVLVFFIFLKGTFDFLSNQNYLEQIVIITGFFVIYFLIVHKIEKILIEKKEKEQKILEQSNHISRLEYELNQLKNNLN